MRIYPAAVAATAALVATCVDAGMEGVQLHGINYDLRSGNDWEPVEKRCKGEQRVRDELHAIKKIAGIVRLYSTQSCGRVPLILDHAKSIGLKVALGIWVGSGDPNNLRKDFAAEKNALEGLIKSGKIDRNVVGIHVGSEALYREQVNYDQAIGFLYDVRGLLNSHNIFDLPLTVADTIDSWNGKLKNGNFDLGGRDRLLAAVDYVSVNQFSQWERAGDDEAMAIHLDRIRSIRALAASKGKKVVISETGWSSFNEVNPHATKSNPDMQIRYFKDFYHQAVAHGFEYFWFTAFDAKFHAENPAKPEDAIEAYFGVFKDGTTELKDNFKNLQLGQRQLRTIKAGSGRFLSEVVDANDLGSVTGIALVEDISTNAAQERAGWLWEEDTGRIRSLNSDRCLDAFEVWDGGKVHTYTCKDGNANQKWTFDPATKTLRIHGRFCLDNDPAQGFKLQIYGCSPGNPNQQWDVSGTAVVPENPNAVRFFSKESPRGFGQLVRLGEEVGFAFSSSPTVGSTWVYDPATHLVRSDNSNYCLDAYEGWSGGRVHVWSCNAGERNQHWNYDAATGQLKHMKHESFCLDGDQAANNGNGKVQLWSCHLWNNNQVWRKVSAPAKAVRLKSGDGSVVELISQNDIAGKSPAAPGDSQVWFHDARSQMVMSKWNGECLDADKGEEGARVHTWGCMDWEKNQKWEVDPTSGLVKHSKHQGFCLAYDSASSKQVVVKRCNANDPTQKFTIPSA